MMPFLREHGLVISAVLLALALGGGTTYLATPRYAEAPEHFSLDLPEVAPIVEEALSAGIFPEERVTQSEEPAAPAATQGAPEAPAAFLPTLPAPPVPDLSGANGEVRAAIVNILCASDGTAGIGSTAGSGVLIDPRGIIMTNAHVAQGFLLERILGERRYDCEIRTGNPAKSAYEARLSYLSPRWLSENAGTLKESRPSGTGENDFAILVIDGSAVDRPLPSSLPYIAPAWYEPGVGQVALVAGYPAGFLTSAEILSSLSQVSATALVKDVYTFEGRTVDVLSLGGSPVAQQGISGGAVVDVSGDLIALAVTSTLEGDTSVRDLRAITLAHVARAFRAEQNGSITAFLALPPENQAAEFEDTLEEGLLAVLRAALGL